MKRYLLQVGALTRESPDGPWVLYEDANAEVERLRAELEQVRAVRDRAVSVGIADRDQLATANAEVERLRAELAIAWDDAEETERANRAESQLAAANALLDDGVNMRDRGWLERARAHLAVHAAAKADHCDKCGEPHGGICPYPISNATFSAPSRTAAEQRVLDACAAWNVRKTPPLESGSGVSSTVTFCPSLKPSSRVGRVPGERR